MRADGFDKSVQMPAMDKPGKMTQVKYDSAAADLVNYMVYMAEPAAHNRKLIGLIVLLVLSVLTVLAYAIKKEFWKDVH